MVKDLRTGVERSDAQRVLDGDLDPFMAAALAARVDAKHKDAELNYRRGKMQYVRLGKTGLRSPACASAP